jgi:hypothetical protein
MLDIQYPPVKRGKLIVWGLLASYPFGGMTWQVLHHLAGLRKLGFDVWYVEDSDKAMCDPNTFWPTFDYESNVSYLARQMESVGLAGRWVFRPPGVQDRCLGATNLPGLKKLYREADAVLNLCGSHQLRGEHDVIDCLVYLETDPVPKQVAVANGDESIIDQLDPYDYLFTYGANIGADDCLVPVARYDWYPTRPPVYVDWWSRFSALRENAPLTTIANWKHSGNDVVWGGVKWRWSKHYEFQRFIQVPSRSALPLEIAVGGIDDEETRRLREHGWNLRASTSLSDPAKYRDYIAGSLGEFTAAKEQYVRPRTGWFSDRSVCYLAAGRPVITQETGFANMLPTGEGLLSFLTADEAVGAIDELAGDYARHSCAAEAIAREYFDAERVLGDVLHIVGLI